MHPPTHAMSALRTAAHALHAHLIQALTTLTQRAHPHVRGRAWQAFEQALLDHLRLESELLLPEFELVLGCEAASIREQHERMRQLVVHLGAGPGAALDAAALGELLRRLKDCAAVEERTLYPWAELCMPQRKRGDFIQRSQRAARALESADAAPAGAGLAASAR